MTYCRAAKFTLATLLLTATVGFALAGEAGVAVTPARAQEVALAETGGGEVVLMERKRGDGGAAYFHFEIVNGPNRYAVDVDAIDGSLNKFVKMNQDGGQTPAASGSRPTLAVPVQTGGAPLTYEQAQAVALSRTNGGTIIESEVDGRKGGRVVYEFDIMNNGVKYEVEIDATNGSVLGYKERGRRLSAGHGPALPPAAPRVASSASPAAPLTRLDNASAQNLAIGAIGGGQVTGHEIDIDDGRLVHEIKLVQGNRRYEVEIDDATGTVREMSVD